MNVKADLRIDLKARVGISKCLKKTVSIQYNNDNERFGTIGPNVNPD